MIETHTRHISIETDRGTFEVTFNPSIPYGWDALSKAIAKHISDREFCEALATKHKKEAAVLWIQKQSECAEGYINAIKTALWDDEFAKIKDVIRQIDIEALFLISTNIANEYSDYYKKHMSEGLEP